MDIGHQMVPRDRICDTYMHASPARLYRWVNCKPQYPQFERLDGAQWPPPGEHNREASDPTAATYDRPLSRPIRWIFFSLHVCIILVIIARMPHQDSGVVLKGQVTRRKTWPQPDVNDRDDCNVQRRMTVLIFIYRFFFDFSNSKDALVNLTLAIAKML